MAVVARFALSTPILRETVERVPGAEIEVAGHGVTESDEFSVRYWVESPDAAAFEDGLDADPTVASHERLTEDRGRLLYQVRLTEAGRAASIVPPLGEYGGEFLSGHRAGDGWRIRLRFPNESSFQSFADACRSRDGVRLTPERMSRNESYDGSGVGLTPSQREAIAVALELGYFDVPRRATLVDIADRLGVSDQAVSERLRRGQRCVFERVLFANAE